MSAVHGELHHVGIVVEDLDAAVAAYERLFGAQLEQRAEAEGMRFASLRSGAARIELIAATAPESAVGSFLERRGPGLHHLAFAVADIDASLTALRAQDVPLVDEEARPGVLGHRIAFLHPSATGGVLTELVEA